jgi:hypothetical protein
VLRDPSDNDWAIEAIPVHWHTVLYEALIYNGLRRDIALDDCWTALRTASITWTHDGDYALKALMSCLDNVRRCGPRHASRTRTVARL